MEHDVEGIRDGMGKDSHPIPSSDIQGKNDREKSLKIFQHTCSIYVDYVLRMYKMLLLPLWLLLLLVAILHRIALWVNGWMAGRALTKIFVTLHKVVVHKYNL